MRKTSVYLTEAELERLAQLARRERRSQAQVIRDAISAYRGTDRTRVFAMTGVADGPGDSIADIADEDLLKGFGG